MDIEIIPHKGAIKHVPNVATLRIKIGSAIFTFEQGDTLGPNGKYNCIFLKKVDNENPLNEPVVITPVHTNKIKIS